MMSMERAPPLLERSIASWSSEVAEMEPTTEPRELGTPRDRLPRLLARPCTEATEESLAADNARVCAATPERRELRPLIRPFGIACGIGSEPEDEEQEAREFAPSRISRLLPETKRVVAAAGKTSFSSPQPC